MQRIEETVVQEASLAPKLAPKKKPAAVASAAPPKTIK
jgi:hypothetical protein